MAALAVILVQRKDLRRPALYMAMLGAVLNPLGELLYFRDYWRPDSLFGKGQISIEDVIFGASIYALALVTYPFLTGKRFKSPTLQFNSAQWRKILLYISAVASIILTANLILGVNSVVATGLAGGLVGLFIILKRPDLLLPNVITGMVFTVVVCLGYILALDVIAPQILKLWWLLWGTPLGATFLGNVPLTELAWFLGISSIFSVLYLEVTDQVYVPSVQRHRLVVYQTDELPTQ